MTLSYFSDASQGAVIPMCFYVTPSLFKYILLMFSAEKAMERVKGILRLAPAWVPRSFCRPEKWIKLHPEDYYLLFLLIQK